MPRIIVYNLTEANIGRVRHFRDDRGLEERMKFLEKTSPRPLQSPRRVVMLVCAVIFWTANILLIYNHKLAVTQLPDTAPAVARDGIVYQSTDYSCGPASLATVFRHYNIIKSEREWGELAGTNLSVGTTLYGLRGAVSSTGFEAVEMSPSFDQLDLIAWPSIVFQSRLYHLVTFWGIDENGGAIIRDPARGILKWNSDMYEINTPGKPGMLVLYPGPVPTCNPETQPIEIARFQNMLSQLGYYRGKINGDWSGSLSNAISDFQHDMEITETGLADAETSLYIEGAWRLVSRGPIEPFMRIDQRTPRIQRSTPILAILTPSDE